MSIDNVYFRAWVANAVHAVSGIWPYDWQGSQRKCALTVEEVRAVARQVAGYEKVADDFSASMRHSRLAATHIATDRKKLH